MNSSKEDVKIDIPGVIKVYKNGIVERSFPDPKVPPSPHDPETGVSSKDIKLPPNEHGLALSGRLYLPKMTSPKKIPVLVYFHGGAFCLRSTMSKAYHRYMNIIASMAQILIVSVEYRLAPENPLPAAYEDSWTALKLLCSNPGLDPWMAEHGDFEALFIGGDSAGGNIVHNLAMMAGSEQLDDQGLVKIRGAYLSHPFFLDENSSLTLGLMYKIWEFVYPNAPGGLRNVMINPSDPEATSLKGLACSKILVLVAGQDVLRNGGIRYYKAVAESGYEGNVELYEHAGEHVYHVNNPDAENSKLLFQRLTTFLQK